MTAALKKRPLESRRIDLRRQIALRFRDFGNFVAEYSTNLSMTGMFVQSNEPHPPGTPVTFEFKLEDGMRLIDGKGWVVWVRDTEEDPGQPPGMGIEFTELSTESRRVIRQKVLDQLGKHEKPFELFPGEEDDEFELTEGPPARRRSKIVLFLLALAIFAAGALAFALWSWLSRATPDEGSSSRRTTPSAVAASREEDSAPSEDPSASQLESTVQGWADAWSRRDVDAYLSFYADTFEPNGGLTRSSWEARRRERLTSQENIRVILTALTSEPIDVFRARVSFSQSYRSDSYFDVVRKTLEMVRQPEGWKIEREIVE
jgi:uncharacterized protein (TIGR02266 family)